MDDNVVKLITRIGAPPACPVGSPCTGYGYDYGYGYGYGAGACGFGGFGGWSSMFGAVTEIPLSAIVSFTHNAI